jgi:thiamine biosynthesis lipoprotein
MSTVHLDGDAEAGTDGPWFGGTNVPSRGCRDIGLDKTVPAVRLPRGVQLDLGGIGKGYAADLVAEELIELGADGVCVNLGGDLRVIGEAPTDAGWVVGLEHPFGGDVLGALQLAQGAIATSTRGKRHWERNGRPVHHLVDPTTGTPAWTGVASVTVVAGEAWRAEVLAKAVFVAGADAGPELLRAAGAGGLIVDDAGAMQRLHGLEEFLV